MERNGFELQFPDASPQPTGRRIRSVSGGSSSHHNSSIGLPRPTTARMIRRADGSVGPNPREVPKPLTISHGTERSNPFPSSGESTNFRFPSRRRQLFDRMISLPSRRMLEGDIVVVGETAMRAAATWGKAIERATAIWDDGRWRAYRC
jgi:hypothetical protein